jgi:FkbM family methyltransferase
MVEHRYGDRRLRVRLEDELAEGWYDRDWDEPPEVGFLREHVLTPGATVFDLGAHQGVVALMLAGLVGPSGRVVAVEASAHNARLAEVNADLNHASQVTVRHAAVAAESGTVLIAPELNARLTTGRRMGTVEVEAVTIDQLANEYGRPDALLIDVEGFEVQALRGAVRTLGRGPTLLVEAHVGAGLEDADGSVADLVAALRGYDLWALDEDAQARGETFRPLGTIPRSRFFLGALSQSRYAGPRTAGLRSV